MEPILEYLAANAPLIGLLVGAITPTLTAVIQQPSWTKTTRTVVAGVVSAVIGVILAAAAGDLNQPGDLVATVTAVIVAAEAFYQKVWKPTNVAPAIELATSGGDGDSTSLDAAQPDGDLPAGTGPDRRNL